MTPVRIVQQTDQTSPRARPGLQAGSVVQTRVLERTGAGQYVISVAGQKVAVRSEMPLQPGAVFSAKVSVRGEQVLFSLTGAAGETKPLVSQFTASALQNGMDAGLSQLLASLGLPASAESFGLLQFAQSMGMKIDARQLRKALSAAQAAGGGEEAAQTALVLDEKGMDASADAVQALAGGMGENSQHGKGVRGGQHDADETENPPQDATQVHADTQDYEDAVHEYVALVDEAAVQNEAGALTVFNTVRGGSDASDGARWVILPFDWIDGYRGDIRLLPAADKKMPRQVIINAKNLHTSWHFVVYCKQGSVHSVRFSRVPELTAQEAAEYAADCKRMLMPAFGSLQAVDYVAALQGFCAQDTAIGTVGGMV